MVAVDIRFLRDWLISICETASPGTVLHLDEECIRALQYTAGLTEEDIEAIKDVREVAPEDLEDFLKGTGKYAEEKK